MSSPEVEPQLAAWPIAISGNNTRFLTKARSCCCWHHGEQNPRSHMTHSLGNGYAGVTKGIPIPFQDLAVSDVVNFLAHLYGEGHQYRSLNVYRSAISSMHTKVDPWLQCGRAPTGGQTTERSLQSTSPTTKIPNNLGCDSGHRLFRETGGK